MIEALFILFILLFSNYLTGSLGAAPTSGNINNFITSNIYILHITVLFVIYFSVKGIRDSDKETNIYTKLRNTLAIWVVYLLIIKLKKSYAIIVFLLFLVLYILHEYKEHNFHHDKHEYLDKHINKIIMINKGLIFIVILYGLTQSPIRITKVSDLLRSL